MIIRFSHHSPGSTITSSLLQIMCTSTTTTYRSTQPNCCQLYCTLKRTHKRRWKLHCHLYCLGLVVLYNSAHHLCIQQLQDVVHNVLNNLLQETPACGLLRTTTSLRTPAADSSARRTHQSSENCRANFKIPADSPA